MQKHDKIVVKDERKYFYRFSVHQRVQHIILFVSIITLALTGFPLRYPDQAWSRPLYDLFGGTDLAPTIHRYMGSILLMLFVYHTIYWLRLFYINRIKPLIKARTLSPRTLVLAVLKMEMMPNLKDITDFFHALKYLFYFTNVPPQHDRFSWREKFDYFAPYWGIPVLGPAGMLLWWRDEVSHFLPGIVLNAAYIMHTDEALLAVLFLFFVHWYNVHYAPEKFPAATVWITGYLSEEEMIHEHYAEYTRVMTEEGYEAQIKAQH